MKKIILLLSISFALTSTYAVANEDLLHIRLKDRLDRPSDGYCLDILGTSTSLRIDLPLFVHNCKPFATADSAVIYSSKGQLIFPAADVCVTAFGVNNTVLTGTSVLLRKCDERSAFFEATNLQAFDYTKNGQFKLRGYELCLTAGNVSTSTYSPQDRWRVLSLEDCSTAALSHSAWDRVVLKQ